MGCLCIAELPPAVFLHQGISLFGGGSVTNPSVFLFWLTRQWHPVKIKRTRSCENWMLIMCWWYSVVWLDMPLMVGTSISHVAFHSMKQLGVSLLPAPERVVWRRVTPPPSIKSISTHFYTWVERGTVRVKCLAQEHSDQGLNPDRSIRNPESSALTMRPARLQLNWTVKIHVLCTSHWTCFARVLDINKFLWMVRIGGSTEKGQHIKEHDYYTSTGEFRVDRGGSQILLNCLMYKMCYYRFGSVYTEQGNKRVFFYVGTSP